MRHAEAQIEAYGKVLGVNLVDNNNKSGLQKQMGDAYDKAVERLGNDKFKYGPPTCVSAARCNLSHKRALLLFTPE